MDDAHQDPTETTLTPKEARGAVKGNGVILVLVASLICAVAAMLIVVLFVH